MPQENSGGKQKAQPLKNQRGRRRPAQAILNALTEHADA
jgi:hypothetical protein